MIKFQETKEWKEIFQITNSKNQLELLKNKSSNIYNISIVSVLGSFGIISLILFKYLIL